MTIIAGTSTDCIDSGAAAAAGTAVTSQGEAGTSSATDMPTSVAASGYPSGLYGFSNSEFSALPAVRRIVILSKFCLTSLPQSASFSQLGSAESGAPFSYEVVESGSGVDGAYAATGQFQMTAWEI